MNGRDDTDGFARIARVLSSEHGVFNRGSIS
jgi:hypothetical protein